MATATGSGTVVVTSTSVATGSGTLSVTSSGVTTTTRSGSLVVTPPPPTLFHRVAGAFNGSQVWHREGGGWRQVS